MRPLPTVCIVTPGPLGSSPRVVKEAHALIDAGYRVKVVATRTVAVVEPRDAAILARAPFEVERIDLRARWRWRLRRVGQEAMRALHATTGAAAHRAFSAAAGALTAAACRTRADLFIAHYPAALPAAARAARRHGARYAYDAEDFHPGDWPDTPAHARDRALLDDIERRFLPGCAYVSAASPQIADAYAETYAIARPCVVLNVFPRAEAPRMREKSNRPAAPGPSLYWFSQAIGPDRGLECAVRAIARAGARPHLYLRGNVVSGYGATLARLADDCGVADRLHLLAPTAPEEMARLAACFDVGLCGEAGHTRANAKALSNKLFTYLLAGVPAALSDTPAQRAFAEANGLEDWLYPANDDAALAALLDRLLATADSLAKARARAARLAETRYNWEYERAKLVACVARALGRAA